MRRARPVKGLMLQALLLAGLVAAPLGSLALFVQMRRHADRTGAWPAIRRFILAVAGTVVLAAGVGVAVVGVVIAALALLLTGHPVQPPDLVGPAQGQTSAPSSSPSASPTPTTSSPSHSPTPTTSSPSPTASPTLSPTATPTGTLTTP